jgi:4a-hydroxytetrahydrobiopterin dehydratase
MARLTDEQIEQKLSDSQWRREGSALVRELQLEDFLAAIARVNAIAEVAEQAGHHPDILVHGWNKLRLELSTHSEGAITDADFDLAARIDLLG